MQGLSGKFRLRGKQDVHAHLHPIKDTPTILNVPLGTLSMIH